MGPVGLGPVKGKFGMFVPLKSEVGEGLSPELVRVWLTSSYSTFSADFVLGASSSELETGCALLLVGKILLSRLALLEDRHTNLRRPWRVYL